MIEEYTEIINQNIHIFDKIQTIVENSGEKIEGNCFTIHGDIKNRSNKLINKQINLYKFSKQSNSILEIGFNAGHSTLIFLLANKESKITVFDICSHKYTTQCYKYLSELFPNRLELIIGDSNITVPKFLHDKEKKLFDLIHIDGCHLNHKAEVDYKNCISFGKIIIADDTHMPFINNLVNRYIQQNILSEEDYLKTHLYEHRILKNIL